MQIGVDFCSEDEVPPDPGRVPSIRFRNSRLWLARIPRSAAASLDVIRCLSESVVGWETQFKLLPDLLRLFVEVFQLQKLLRVVVGSSLPQRSNSLSGKLPALHTLIDLECTEHAQLGVEIFQVPDRIIR